MTRDSKGALQTQQQVKEITGSAENERDVYALAAEVLGNMQGKSMDEIIKIIDSASKNPAGFADSWTPEQKKKLKALAERMPGSHSTQP